MKKTADSMKKTAIFITQFKKTGVSFFYDELSYGQTGEVKLSPHGFGWQFRAHGDYIWFAVNRNEFQFV